MGTVKLNCTEKYLARLGNKPVRNTVQQHIFHSY